MAPVKQQRSGLYATYGHGEHYDVRGRTLWEIAAEVLRRRGLAKGAHFGPNGEVSAVGALALAARTVRGVALGGELLVAIAVAKRVLDVPALDAWSDRPEVTEFEVRNLFVACHEALGELR